MTKKEVEKMCADFIAKLPFELKGYVVLVERANVFTNNMYEAANLSQINLLYLLNQCQARVLERLNKETERKNYDVEVKTGTSDESPKL